MQFSYGSKKEICLSAEKKSKRVESKPSIYSDYINGLKKISIVFFYFLSLSILIACSSSEDSNGANNSVVDGGLSDSDEDDNDNRNSPEVSINSASWYVRGELLFVDGTYTPGQNDSAARSDSIIISITDVDMPDIVLGTVSVSPADDDEEISWSTQIPDIVVIPCKIIATAGDASDISPVANSDDICGKTGNPPPPVNPPPANTRPMAIFSPSVNQSITLGDSISFMGDASSDPDGDIPLTYEWTFEGGSPATSSVANPVVQFNTSGSFSASLTVTDSRGLASSATSITVDVAAVVVNQPPNAVIGSMPAADNTATITINAGDSITYNGVTSSDPDGNIPLTYSWQFTSGSIAGSTMATPPAVQYNTVGNYQTTLTVTDSLGLASTIVRFNVAVVDVTANLPPMATITSTPVADNLGNININTGDSINFSGVSSVDPDGNMPLSYAWAFDGGVPASSTNVTPGAVQFSAAGSYQATLTVTDSLGLASTITSVTVVVVDATANLAPTATITSTPVADVVTGNININTGDSVTFSGDSSVDPDGNMPLSYAWTFDGGVPAISTNVTPGAVLFNTAGTFQATLTVTDSLGLASIVASVSVTVMLPPAAAQTISFVVMNDLHANLIPHSDLNRLADGTTTVVTRGGLSRIAAEANRIRTENPNSAFINIGDTFYGSVEAFYSDGNDVVTAVNQMGIDVGVPGNWDFAYGPNVTRARFTNDNPPLLGRIVDKPNYPNIAANVASAGLFARPYLLPPTFNMNIGGIEVGFIGITSDIVPTMSPGLTQGMTFLQGETNYRDLINQFSADLRNAATPAQIVVVMSELGIHKDKQLADIVNAGSVDVFFSAHTHELTTTPLTSASGAVVVEAGNDTYLGRMDIGLNQSNAVVSRNWSVIPIESSITGDAPTQAAVDSVRAKYLLANPNLMSPAPNSSQTLTQSIDTVLTTTSRPIARDHALENSFNNLMTDLQRKATGSQIAISRGFRFGVHLPGTVVSAADFTIEDVYRFIPVPYTLSNARVSGLRLKQIIEQNATEVFSTNRFLHSGGWFDGYSGLSINLNLDQPDGQRLTGLSVYDATNIMLTPVLDADEMSITGCTRPLETADTLCAYQGFVTGSVVPFPNPNSGAPYTAIDFLIDALQDTVLYDPVAPPPERSDITDSNNTPMWPVSEFIQPINGVP